MRAQSPDGKAWQASLDTLDTVTLLHHLRSLLQAGVAFSVDGSNVSCRMPKTRELEELTEPDLLHLNSIRSMTRAGLCSLVLPG